jgi:hypothetical protein
MSLPATYNKRPSVSTSLRTWWNRAPYLGDGSKESGVRVKLGAATISSAPVVNVEGNRDVFGMVTTIARPQLGIVANRHVYGTVGIVATPHIKCDLFLGEAEGDWIVRRHDRRE